MKVDNAVIMAAGTSSRFAPLSYERPKALIEVRGEVLIERQIRQIKAAGIDEVFVVTGYKAEQLSYLEKKCGVRLIHNGEYLTRNNNSSIMCAREHIGNTYICSADNYFCENPFESDVSEAYYAAVYADGHTGEWCMSEDGSGDICAVTIGGENAWYMLGHVFWSESFSKRFIEILDREYDLPATADKLWEQIFIEHLSELKMKIRKYPNDMIFEFDTLDELREFDKSYVTDTRSDIIKSLAARLDAAESSFAHFNALKSGSTAAAGFRFTVNGTEYEYLYASKTLKKLD